MVTDNDRDSELLRAKINQETAKIPWSSLQRFFAQGTAVWVGQDLDLVEVALAIAEDSAERVGGWTSEGRVSRVSDEQARSWIENDALVWAVVVRPWVLVQDLGDTGDTERGQL